MSASWKAASLAERLRSPSDIHVRVCAWAAARLLSPSRLPGVALLILHHGRLPGRGGSFPDQDHCIC